jgi:ribose transport system permease protein
MSQGVIPTLTESPTPWGSRLSILSPKKFSALYLWALFMILFGFLQFHLFLTANTAQLVFSQGAVTAVLAISALVPLTTETYDLAVGETMSLAVVCMAWLSMHTRLPILVIALAVVLGGCVTGFVSGAIVVRLRVNSLIATLGMLEVLSAAQLYVANNQQVVGRFPAGFTTFGNGAMFGIPYLDIVLVVLAVVVWFVLEQTPIGREMFAIGGNREAARLTGIRTDRIVWGSLVTSGGIAAFAGVMYAAQVGAYTSDIGQGYLFPALAAVFFGAAQLSGRPNVWGTLIAYFALAFGIHGVSLAAGAGAFWVSPLFQGVALILAVALSASQGGIGRRRDGSIRRLRWRKPGGPGAGLNDGREVKPAPGGNGRKDTIAQV